MTQVDGGSTEAESPGFDDSPAIRHIAHPDWFKVGFLDLREDLEEALASGKKGLLVYFGQENCAYCEALMDVNFQLADIVDYTRRHFDVVAIDIWGAGSIYDMDGDELTEREFSILNQTNFTPSFIFYDSRGQQAYRVRGYYPPYRFRAVLEYLADGHYLFEDFRSYLGRAYPPPRFESGGLNEEDFFESPPYFLDRSRFPASQPLVVFFEQGDCHACDVLHSEPLTDASVRETLSFLQVVQLDMWSATPVLIPDGRRLTAREWADEMDIHYAPTLVFFDENGKEIIRVDSVVQLYRLGRVLEFVVGGGYHSGMNYQQWHAHRLLRNGTE